MKSLHIAAIASVLLLLTLAGCGGDSHHATPADTPTTTAIPTVVRTATPLPTNTASPAPTASASPPASSSPTASASPTATATENPLRLPALHAEPDPNGRGRIVDAEGREVLLRGVNLNAFVEYWQGGEFPTVFSFTEADADLMAAIGWNTVRLLISWSRFEPEPDVYDPDYIRQVGDAVALLASRGIYSIIDLHQDAWGATLVAPPDTTCMNGQLPALGWDGAPGWATLDGGAARCAPGGLREASPAVVTSFANFFANAPGPGDIGIRDRYVAMLSQVAAAFGPQPGVIGYDLMNEPNAFTAEEEESLSTLYGQAVQAIRSIEAAQGDAPHLIFFEPSALWSAIGSGAPPDFPRDRDVVYAPHIYTGGFDGGPISMQAFAVAATEAKAFGGAPVLSGEWGSDPHRATPDGDTYFLDHQSLQDHFFFGATLWTWRESCGDPHKQADFRAGRIPTVWGEFDVDCTTNAVTGLRQDLIDQLTRAYVRAAPGELTASTYDPGAGAFTASGKAAAPGSQLLVFYPGALHGEPELNTVGLEDVHTVIAPSDNLYVVGRATGGDWSLFVP